MSRDGVFISYSHRDRRWMDMLRVHLRFLEREHNFFIWDDSKIRPGTEWRREIARAIESARVGILLISAHYLTSEFVIEEELPPLLAAAKEDGARIFPLIVSHCMFRETESLSRFQSFNSPLQPLIEMTEGERDALFVKVTREIRSALLTEIEEKNQPVEKSGNGIKDKLRLSLARIAVLLVLNGKNIDPEGITITGIYNISKFRNRKLIVKSLKEMETSGIIEKTKKGKNTLWKLSKEGRKLAEDFKNSVTLNLGLD